MEKNTVKPEDLPGTAHVTPSGGNIFLDLGFDEEEAENLLIRASLMLRLRQFIEDEGLTQEEAAERLGVHQPRISDLMRGKISHFSIDALVNLLARAGLHLKIAFEQVA